VKRGGTIEAMLNLAAVYSEQRKHGQAEKLFMQAGPLCRSEEHLLRCMTGLSTVYDAQRRHEDALEASKVVLERTRKFRGEDRPYTISSMSNLAVAYGRVGKVQEAVNLLTQATEASIRKRGESYPDTLRLKANLAGVMIDLGRFDEADQLLVVVFETRRKLLGYHHYLTLQTLQDRAALRKREGQLLQAIIMQEKYLQAMAEAYGEERIAQDKCNLETYKLRAGYEEYIEEIGWRVLPYPEQIDIEN
jgi:hypothetical protein